MYTIFGNIVYIFGTYVYLLNILKTNVNKSKKKKTSCEDMYVG